MSWNPWFISLILFSTIIDYYSGYKIATSNKIKSKRLYLWLSLITNLGFLAYFKYANFFLENVQSLSNTIFKTESSLLIDVILPVGISFYTFQSMCYTIDIYYEKLKPSKSFLEFSLYVTFFPQLVAGPIVRARDFLPQLKVNKLFKNINFQFAANYFLMGLFKKVVIADNIATFSDPVFANPENYGTLATWIGAVAYSIQIYCDFSGYSDMAIGIAALLGFKLMENFDMPYLATNITQFWRKWHISLSTWLRDYLFIPLGGSRGTRLFYFKNLMLTMLLGGLWHGASWNFIIWGALHGTALIIHKLLQKENKIITNNLWNLNKFLSWFLTMVFVIVTWVFFRATTLNDAITVLKKMFSFSESSFDDVPLSFVILLLIVVLSQYAGNKYFMKLEENKHVFNNSYLQGALYGIIIFMIILFSNSNNQAFIYFQF